MSVITHNDMKQCRICKIDKELNQFKVSKKNLDGYSFDCIECQDKKWKEHRRLSITKFYQTHKKKIALERSLKREEKRKYDKKYRKKTTLLLKQEAMNAYGGKCNCCGETQLDFLAIDHINGGGNKERKAGIHYTGTAMYRWLRKRGFPEGFRVLCHNCNWSAHLHNGTCIHKLKIL